MSHHEHAARALIAAGTGTLALLALALIVAGLWRVHARRTGRAATATEPTQVLPVPARTDEGATEDWSPMADIGAQDVSSQLMTTDEKVDAIRAGAVAPDLDSDAFEKELLARFDKLIGEIVAELPDEERLTFESFRARTRGLGELTDPTAKLDLVTLGFMLAQSERHPVTAEELAQLTAEAVAQRRQLIAEADAVVERVATEVAAEAELVGAGA